MNQLQQYLDKWKLINPTLLATTPASSVYRVEYKDQIAALKILTKLGRNDGASGAGALRHFGGRSAVQLYEADEGAHLVSFVDGRSLKDLVADGQDVTATEIICDLLGKLHRISPDIPTELISMEENFRSLFLHAQRSVNDRLLKHAVGVAEHLLVTENSTVVLHGDIHHLNILESTSQGWLAIDPKGLVGEPTYDFANVFYNPDDMPDLVENQERVLSICGVFSKRFEIDPKRILEFAFAYGCLSACWALDDGLSPHRRSRMAMLIGNLLKSRKYQ